MLLLIVKGIKKLRNPQSDGVFSLCSSPLPPGKGEAPRKNPAQDLSPRKDPEADPDLSLPPEAQDSLNDDWHCQKERSLSSEPQAPKEASSGCKAHCLMQANFSVCPQLLHPTPSQKPDETAALVDSERGGYLRGSRTIPRTGAQDLLPETTDLPTTTTTLLRQSALPDISRCIPSRKGYSSHALENPIIPLTSFSLFKEDPTRRCLSFLFGQGSRKAGSLEAVRRRGVPPL